MSASTPGPWRYHYTSAAQARAKSQDGTDGGGACGVIKAGPPGLHSVTIAFLPHHRDPSRDGEGEANARLIAAAPEMLAALESLTGCLEACAEEFRRRNMAEEDLALADLEMAYSIIAKAKGARR